MRYEETTEKTPAKTTVEKQLKNLGKRITALRKKKGFSNYPRVLMRMKIGLGALNMAGMKKVPICNLVP